MNAVFEVLDGLSFALDRLLDFVLDVLDYFGVEGRVLNELMQLGLLLL